LFDGYYYEEVNPKKPSERQRLPFAKSSFSKQIMNIDLSFLNSNDEDVENLAHTNTMLNVSELAYTLDSLYTNYDKDEQALVENSVQRASVILSPPKMSHRKLSPIRKTDAVEEVEEKEVKNDSIPQDLLSILDRDKDRFHVLEIAVSNMSSSEFSIMAGKDDLLSKVKNINGHWLALYDKFVMAFACILMFFIGAPLGAIIRKGGLGLPIVFAVLIFIIFHFINTFGRKLAQENGIPPFFGSWMSSIILGPIAILLTYRATNDIGMINMDSILLPLQKAVQKVFKLKDKE